MEREELKERLTERLSEKERVSCKEALTWAHALGVSPKRITELLDEKGIKVYGCQLGCF